MHLPHLFKFSVKKILTPILVGIVRQVFQKNVIRLLYAFEFGYVRGMSRNLLFVTENSPGAKAY